MPDQAENIALFVTPHGFGHAARAAAVMNALLARCPSIHFEIYTTVPEWFFSSSVSAPYSLQAFDCDVGLVQKDALIEDVPSTLERLNRLYPFDPGVLTRYARQVREKGCRLVISDIAPIGIAVAETAGLPSVLIENFTWDWIYANYVDEGGVALRTMIDYLAQWIGKATYHIQTEPVSCPSSKAALVADPVARPLRESRSAIRRQLGVPLDRSLVLVTMGGSLHHYKFMSTLAARDDVSFILPGVKAPEPVPRNLICLPFHSPVYHPDMVMAVDVVVGKLGYSTLAEVWQGGTPFGYVLREKFPESYPLERFAKATLACCRVKAATFNEGMWLDQLDMLLALPRRACRSTGGAQQIADFLMKRLSE